MGRWNKASKDGRSKSRGRSNKFKDRSESQPQNVQVLLLRRRRSHPKKLQILEEQIKEGPEESKTRGR